MRVAFMLTLARLLYYYTRMPCFELVLRSYFAYMRYPHYCTVKRLLRVACMFTLAQLVLHVACMLTLAIRIVAQSIVLCA